MGASVTAPLDQAMTRAKLVTFQPFDLSKWFTLGFAAWLSTLGESGGGINFYFPTGGRGGFPSGGGRPPFPGGNDPFRPVWDWITAHLDWIIAGGVLVAIVAIVVGLLLSWLHSRATFIFLDNLARNEAAIVAPWSEFRPQGNSLFLFAIALGAIWLACFAVVGGLGLIVAWPDIRAAQFGGHALAAILLGLALLPLMLVFALITWCTNNFVAPLMYLRRQTVLPAWREFRTTLLAGNLGSFVLFLLLQFVLRMAIGIASMILGCATCCLGFLPYLGTVITLPLYVFDRCYALYFLEQFGPEYRIFREIEEPISLGPWPPPPVS